MRSFSLILLLLLITTSGYSQKMNDDYLIKDTTVSELKLLNFVEVPYYFIMDKALVQFQSNADIKRFSDTMKVELPQMFNEFDPEKNTMAIISYSGIDCHSWFKFEFLKLDDDRSYKIYVTIRSGECRAGGNNYTRWVSVPKLPVGYSLSFIKLIDEHRN